MSVDDASDMDISDTDDAIMHRRERSREDIPIISELINGIQRLADGCVLRSCGGITPPNRSRSNSPHTRFTSQATPSTNGTTSLSHQPKQPPPSVPAVILERFAKCLSGGILQLGMYGVMEVHKIVLYWFLTHSIAKSQGFKTYRTLSFIGYSSILRKDPKQTIVRYRQRKILRCSKLFLLVIETSPIVLQNTYICYQIQFVIWT